MYICLANYSNPFFIFFHASSLFTLLVAEVSLRKLCFGGSGVADLLVGVGLLERASTSALHLRLVGGGVISVACDRHVSSVCTRQEACTQPKAAQGRCRNEQT
jgi:hypothetical protein